MIGIYKITNLINSKCYIGQSRDIYRRLNEHKSCSSNKRLREDIQKFGVHNFTFELLEETTVNKLDEREIFYISFYNSTNEELGYNISPGGTFSGSGEDYVNPATGTTLISKGDITTRCSLSELEIYISDGWVHGPSEKWREAHRQGKNTDYFKTHKFIGPDNGFYGKHHTEETKQRIRDSMPDTSYNWRGKHHTEESKQKMRGRRPSISGEHNPNFGKRGNLSPIFGRKRINNGTEEKCVSVEELQNYLDNGWMLGRLKRS